MSFAAYPALRPYTDETALEGADAMASAAWVAAHSLGMVGFISLTLGVWAMSRPAVLPGGGTTGRAAGVTLALTWLGASLVLPYYGAETFGLQVIADRAAAEGDAGLLELAEAFRYGAVPLAFFGTGLLLLAGAGVALATTVRRCSLAVRVGGTVAGAALATYLPQFFLTPELRIGHGVLLGLGLLTLAAGLLAPRTPSAEPPLVPGRAARPAQRVT